MFQINGKYNTANVYQTRDLVEDSCVEQIQTIVDQPFVEGERIRIMPDCHTGASVCIGYTQTINNKKVCPNFVGVDINCGVLVVNLGKAIRRNQFLDMMCKLDSTIRNNVPSGMNVHSQQTTSIDFDSFLCGEYFINKERLNSSMGTLGGGNHFIELDKDEEGNYYLCIHTGSRNLGLQVASYYQDLAYNRLCSNYTEADIKALITAYKARGLQREIQSKLKEIAEEKAILQSKVVKDLAYLEGEDFDNYIHDMKLCQKFAEDNRRTIAKVIIDKWLGSDLKYYESFETVHNYIDMDNMILRKGAVEAGKNKKLIIPINMAEGSIIGVGKSCEDMNNSAPHGAGRLMSRNEAKKIVGLEEFKQSMEGIYSTCVSEETIDESPMAYKKLNDILPHIKDTVDVLTVIKPVFNYKAVE